MSITFACGTCGKSFTVDDKFAGKKGKCKQCGAVMPIPEGDASGLPDLEVSPSRRPPSPSRPTREEAYGLDAPAPARRALPPGIEEVEPGSPIARRREPRSGGLYDPPRPKRKTSGGVVGLVAKIGLGVFLGLLGLGGAGVLLMNMAGVSSRGSLEAILQERVNLNSELAAILAGVNDVPTARAASPKAVAKLRAISANLRKLKVIKALKTDLDAIKPQYQAPQEQASRQVVQQFARIAAIEGAFDALNTQVALDELDREEKSIPGMTQVQLAEAPAPTLAPDQAPDPAAPDANPTPAPAPNPTGLSSRRILEAMFQERVNLNKQLTSVLSGVKDIPSAQSASPKAVAKLRAIAANLRKLRVAKGLMTDLNALKGKYQAPQEDASRKVIEQIARIAAIEGAWDALDVKDALEELDREEKSIPGMTQAGAPGAPAGPPAARPGPRPGANPNRPSNPRNKAGTRKGMNRPNSPGPG